MKSQLLIIASYNQGKIKEISSLLEPSGWEVKGLDKQSLLPEETGSTFRENALAKARFVYRQFKKTNFFVLADDSGLECEDLNGEPGVRSARYAGPQATDEQNNQKLIHELMQRHDPRRLARYVCALVLIDPEGQETVVEETCEGLITFTPSGTGGFGYDPYFYLPEKKCTMADLLLEEKNKISHRGKALKKICQTLSRY